MPTDSLHARPPAEWAALPRSAGDPVYGDFALGEFLRTAAIGDLRFDVTAHPEGAVIVEHRHASLLLLFVLDGTLEETACGRTTTAPAGALLVRPEGVAHSARVLRSCRLFSIEPGRDWLEGIGAGRMADEFPPTEWSDRMALLTVKVYGAFARVDTGPAAALALTGHLQVLLAELAGPAVATGAPLWLGDVREYLDARLGERLDLPRLARRAGVHPVHLSRAFRRHFGLTLTEYVRQGRMAAAMVRLTTTDDAVATIARDTGFADQSHFTREFRRTVGHSPGGYRAGLRGRPTEGD